MKYISYYNSHLGKMLLASDGISLTGLWFDTQTCFQAHALGKEFMDNIEVFQQTRHWLDIYFGGREPDFSVPVHLEGSDFQKSVWEVLGTIPYGQTVTYGDIAKQIARQKGITHMSAQAVGRAVGRNPISIIVPCHRVIGAGGKLTGYAGGLDKKIALLRLEKIEII